MSSRNRSLGFLVSATIAVAAIVLAPGVGHAASWYSNPNNCSSVGTVSSKNVSGRTVEIRQGQCAGVRHFWGRIIGYDSDRPDYIRFEVDRDANSPIDGVSWYAASNRNYTAAYPDEPGFFFRACYVTSSTGTCTGSNSTGWYW